MAILYIFALALRAKNVTVHGVRWQALDVIKDSNGRAYRYRWR
jgi:hypothetical protein